jgi:hypothetical protein
MSCGGSDTTSTSRVEPPPVVSTTESNVAATPQFAEELDGSVAVDLAPSQLTENTVARPATPEPCVVDDLEFWTAQVQLGTTSADAVIRVRNAGTDWCEADVGSSPLIDPDLEFDVWFDPGAWADLVVGHAQIDVNGEKVVVPTAAIASCGWRLTAFFPNDVADDPCTSDQIEFAVRDRALLVHNISTAACTLGDVVPTGISAPAPDTPRAGPSIVDLARGDIVAFDLIDDASCGEPGVEFASAGSFPVGTPDCITVRSGPGRPYFGSDIGPLAASVAEPIQSMDIGVLLASMDPFRVDQ